MRKLAAVAFSFSAAVFVAVYGKLDPWLAGLGALCALAAVLLPLLLRGRRRLAARLVLGGLAAGFLWTAVYSAVFFRPAQALDGRTVPLAATVAEWPEEAEYGGYSVLVKVETGRFVTLSAVLYVDEQGADLRPGDRISTIAHCTLGDRTFSGEPVTYYTAKGIFLRGEAYGRLDIQRPEHIPVPYWPAALSRGLRESIDRAFPQREAGLVRALVTGNRDNLTDRFTTSLERTGLSHTVAVSGMHLAYLAGLISGLLGKGKRSTAVLTAVWAVLFCGVAGNTPSVLRAAVMILMLQAAPLLGRERDGPTSLGLALMLLLLVNPFSAAHVGLQLSFASVAGIQTASDPIQRWMLARCHLDRPPKGRWEELLWAAPRFVVSNLSATLGATVFTMPLVALHFGTLSLIAPISNLLTLWAVSLLFLGGLAVGVVGLFAPGLAAVLAVPFTPLAQYLNWAIDLLSRPALAALSLQSVYYWAWMALFYLLLAVCIRARGKVPLWMPVCSGVFTLTLALLWNGLTFYSGDLSAAVLNVGQGQSVLVRTGDFLTLVDCGGDSLDDPGDIAADYIQSLGRSTLDLLVVSHYHADHANGIPQLLRRIRVEEIALPDVEEDAPLRAEILSLAEEQGSRVRFVETDQRLELGGGANLTLCAPVLESNDTNELGLTVVATAGDFDVLITGDLSGAGELGLLERVDLPDVELMVVGHHGSDTSTTRELLEATRPDVAVISVGARNSYGHPAQETLLRLDAAGAEIYRTDLHGIVLVTGRGS